MNGWHSLPLGDALTAHLTLERIRESFEAHYGTAHRPANAAVYVRRDATGDLHCEVIAFFTPETAEIARAFGATPCSAPATDGLERLAGGGAPALQPVQR
jgi:hypothetical protein